MHVLWQLRTQAEFEAMHNVKAPAGKRYFQHTKLPDIIGAYPFRSGLTEAQQAHETERRESFLDFLMGVLVRTLLHKGNLACRVQFEPAHKRTTGGTAARVERCAMGV